MEELVQRLQQIKLQVDEILTEKNELKTNLKKKESEIQRLKQLIDIQNTSIREMEAKLKIKRIAEGASGVENEQTRDLKFKINDMIKEIEHVMQLMHQ